MLFVAIENRLQISKFLSFIFPKKPGALNNHQVELMKEHNVYYGGYNQTVPQFIILANDFGPAVVSFAILVAEATMLQ